ncbi:MFS transporter [Actinomadura sp. HBU206391]|uniref:MFS transporter n=1 Tax=Actinomadura sp. HBU206391 TaxID=2731692 RepID=UPI001650355E|nr:MFS transporter [Actinomadura sp. HBU206391]MBC6459402.1 MFS transporter [Actinomadura sp. HBU206391]
MADRTSDDLATVEKAGSKPGMSAALAHRDFALLWSGQALSAIGNRMFPIILALVVLDRHAGAAGLGLVLAVQGISVLVGTVAATSVGDRWRRSRVMMSTDAVRVVGVAVMAAGPTTLPGPVFIVSIVAIGVAEGMFQPAYRAVLPRVLPKTHLQAGNALTSLSQYVAIIIGPSLAGVIIATHGAGPALWIDVATFTASLVTLTLTREHPRARPVGSPEAGLLRRGARDFTEGVRAIRERRWLLASICMSTVVMGFVMAPAFVAAPIEAGQRLGGPQAYGAAFTALGVGSILGAVFGSRIRTHRPGVVATLGVTTISGAMLSLAFLPLAGVLLCWAVTGVGLTIFEILWMTAVQHDVPDHLLGRVLALDWLGSDGLTPLGFALAGVTVSALGTRNVLLAGAILVLVTAPLPLLVRGGTSFSSAATAGTEPPLQTSTVS